MCKHCQHAERHHFSVDDGRLTGCAKCYWKYFGMIDAEPCPGFER